MTSYYEKLKDPRWQKKRLEVLERAGWTCEMCGETTATLHVHHGYYERGEPWDYETTTLKCLCEYCHEENPLRDVHYEIAKMSPTDWRDLLWIVHEYRLKMEEERQLRRGAFERASVAQDGRMDG